MGTSDYLSRKYKVYSRYEKAKPFIVSHVAEELQLNHAQSCIAIRMVLGRLHSQMNFDQFSKVICASLKDD